MLESQVDLAALALPSIETMLKAGAMEIRDVDGGETPFLYASGWSGPGYIMVKAMVSQDFFRRLVLLLAIKLAPRAMNASFVAGNVTGGVVPGWLLSQYLELLLNRRVDFLYVKGTRFRGEVKENPVILVNKRRLEVMAQRIATNAADILDIDFVAGASPGGIILAYRISELLSFHLNKYVPFVYIRECRKAGGHQELITGIQGNPFFEPGMTGLAVGQVGDIDASTEHVTKALKESGFNVFPIHSATHDNQLAAFSDEDVRGIESIVTPRRDLRSLPREQQSENADSTEGRCKISIGSEGIVAEELANFAHSTCVSASMLEEDYGFHVPNAACILFYDNPVARKNLNLEGMDMTYLLTLPQLLNAAKHFRTHSGRDIKCFRSFLVDPEAWNEKRGIKRVARGGTQ